MPRDIHRRMENLERRAPKPQQRRPLVRPELRAYLDEIAARKRDGTLTVEDQQFLDAAQAEVKRRRDAGEIG